MMFTLCKSGTAVNGFRHAPPRLGEHHVMRYAKMPIQVDQRRGVEPCMHIYADINMSAYIAYDLKAIYIAYIYSI